MANVKLFNAALDEAADSPAGIVLRGALDVTTLTALRSDDYQRDEGQYTSQKKILMALNDGTRLPDIELGMRGQHYSSSKEEFTLKDDVYIIDGLQRISTMREFLSRYPDKVIHIGATVHFNTTKEWEKDRFHKLNNWRKRISPNVLLRNLRDRNRFILALYGLVYNDTSFPLYCRVSWSQNMKRTELLTALLLVKIANKLHVHINSTGRNAPYGSGSGGIGGGNIEDLAGTVLRRSEVVGLQVMKENVREFFKIIDEMWGVSSVQYKDKSPHLHGTFLSTLAKLFSDHKDFWQGNKLFVPLPMRRKIKTFPMNDPHVKELCGSGGKAGDVLYELMEQHINSGKRTHRLRAREEVEVA
jgi:hypothetical protein